MNLPVVCFDLDGTLLDTLEDLAAAANTTLSRHGFATHPTDAYRHFVGNGVELLIRRALPADVAASLSPEEFSAIMSTMRSAYAENSLGRTCPYPGITELLAALAAQGTTTAVLTNKPHKAALEVIRHYFPQHQFAAVYGARPNIPLKPDPYIALHLAAELGCAPGDIIYLGDSDVDMIFARAAGMRPIGAAWGFRGADELYKAGAETVCAVPDELLRLHWS